MIAAESMVQTAQAAISVADSQAKGLPLVLLHGSASSKQVFARQFESALARKYRLIAMDLPGHGASGDARDPQAAYTIPALSGTVREVLHKLGVDRAVVFGWSMGGHIAIDLLHSDLDVVGLGLTGTAPVPPGIMGLLKGMKLSRDGLLVSKKSLSTGEAQRFARMCFGPDATAEHVAMIERADGRFRPVFARSALRGDGGNQRHAIEAADIPVAVINGSDDPAVRQHYLAGLSYRHLWGGVCHVIPDGGHAPFLRQPELFNGLLAGLMKDVVQSVDAAPARRQA